MTRRERDERNRRMIAAHRRGVSVARIAESEGLTTVRVYQVIKDWEDVPSVAAGVVVDSGEEVRRTIMAFDQAIEDLGEIAASEGPMHLRIGAVSRALDARERRLKLMAAAGYISRNLAAPLVEQEVAAAMSMVADVLRRNRVEEAVVREIVTAAEERRRAPAIEGVGRVAA